MNSHKLLNWGTSLLLTTIFTLISCDSADREIPKIDDLEVQVNIERWDKELFGLETKQQIAEFLQQHPLFSKHFLHVDQYPHDSLAINYLHSFLSNAGSSVLEEEVNTVFGDLSSLQTDLEQAFKYLRHYYPNAALPGCYAAVTGFAGNDLFVSDSAVIIGLDYYLGEEATFRPLEFPQYILKRYRPEYIVPSIVLLLSSGLNKSDIEDQTMLAEMIYFGKAYYFSKQILPNTPDSLLIGYSGEDLKNVVQNQDVIWAHFVENQLLYESNHSIKKKYMDERPKTLEIGNKCPGRIGEWLGWQIVTKYAIEQDVSLQALMEASDAQQIFMQSRYKPRLP